MPDTQRPRSFNRRRLLLGGGAAAVTVLGAGAIWGSSAFADSVAGGRFDIKAGAERFLREKGLCDGTVLQSFAFDNANENIYFVQVTSGSDPKKGYLTVTKSDYRGNQLGYMHLRGFGHGVSIGVEPSGSAAYLWTETDANPGSGYGKAITRFKFVNKQTLTYGSSSLKVHRPVSGSTSNQPAVDMLNKRIALRYRMSGVARYAIFNLADVTNGKYSPLHDFAQVGIEDGETFQGFCLHGNYVYQMVGTSYTDAKGANPPAKHGNTYLSSIDVTTGKLVQRARTEAAYSLSYREPEGMAVQLTSPPKLQMGFASGASGARKYSLYYKPGDNRGMPRRSSRTARPSPTGDPVDCPCDATRRYAQCCGPWHAGLPAPNPEALMRSRYSAFALGNRAYLLKTWHPDTRPDSLDLEPATRWAGLQILECSGGSNFHTAGTVTFRAQYVSDGRRGVLSEKSSFVRIAGAWLYRDGIVSGEVGD